MLLRILAAPTAALTFLAALLAPAGATAAAREDVMSELQAGQYFMSTACALNKAVEEMQRIVYGPDNRITHAEVKRDLPRIKRATGQYGEAHYDFGRALLHSPARWPSSVSNRVDRLIGNRLQMARLLKRASNAASAREWVKTTNRAHEIAVSTDVIRARLDLPPPGRGC